MASLEMPHHHIIIDLECGHRSSTVGVGGATTEAEEVVENVGSACNFTDADDDVDSCNSNEFYSTTADADDSNSYDDDYSYDACGSEILVEEGLDLEIGDENKKLHHLLKHSDNDDDVVVVERDCRICHLSLVSSSPTSNNNGIAIELGCSCKDDLAAAHKHCAEIWFKIKGNKTCEICNSIARNVVGPNDIEANHQFQDNAIADNNATATSSSALTSSHSETRTCLNGHRFLNFLLACMVFAFVISWLFHFNIPS